MRADRLLRLIVLLQRHGRATAPWLAEQLEVSERTVLRDMEALSVAGVPVYTERGRGGGCVLLEGFTTDASGLTAAEAQAVFAWTSRDAASDLGLGAQLTGALAKIAASASSSVVERAEALGSVLVSDRRRWFADAEKVPELPVLREAAVTGRRVRMSYQGMRDDRPRTRTVDPYGLVDQSGRWYLVAAHRGQPRTYRVSRIVRVVVLPDPARRPDDRDLATVWDELRRGFERERAAPVVLELAVAAGAHPEARVILQGQLAAGTSIEHIGHVDGRERWRATMRAHGSALAFVMAWAPQIQVVDPAEFADQVRDQAERVLAAYPERSSADPSGPTGVE
jgi:predicted DNA-binding transcriptional regulator YafY